MIFLSCIVQIMDIENINDQHLAYLARNNRVTVTEKFIVVWGLILFIYPYHSAGALLYKMH